MARCPIAAFSASTWIGGRADAVQHLILGEMDRNATSGGEMKARSLKYPGGMATPLLYIQIYPVLTISVRDDETWDKTLTMMII